MNHKSEVFAADGQSTLTELGSVTLTAAADAASVSLREGGAGGTIKLVVSAALGTTSSVSFPMPVESATGAWYVDFTAGTAPSVTVTGL